MTQHLIAIECKDVRKIFPSRRRAGRSLLLRLLHSFGINTKPLDPPVEVLHGVDLQITQGSVVGIIGNNGAGKTTLLRVIAGIYRPNGGSVRRVGRIVPVINLHAAMQDRLTVRGNIRLLCALLRFPAKEIPNLIPSILRLANLEEYAEACPYQLSSGMQQRLVFAVAMHSKPEILLLDEAFSVGDAPFRERAEERLHTMLKSGATIIIAAHDLEFIERACDRVLWLHKGSIEKDGDPKETVKAYLDMCHSR